jgi:hypothetical protein
MPGGGGVLCESYTWVLISLLDLVAVRLQPQQITITGNSLALAASCELLLRSTAPDLSALWAVTQLLSKLILLCLYCCLISLSPEPR